MNSHFFATISRMKYINRWGLMRNTRQENIMEHSLEVAILAHALCEIANQRFGEHLNSERACLLGVYHDVSEIYTGDMPTPVKYFNPEISHAYKLVEQVSNQKLLNQLPQDLQNVYAGILQIGQEDQALRPYVKAADKLSALIKCLEEEKLGNREFASARQSLLKAVKAFDLPAVSVFLEEFLPSYSLTLDELE